MEYGNGRHRRAATYRSDQEQRWEGIRLIRWVFRTTTLLQNNLLLLAVRPEYTVFSRAECNANLDYNKRIIYSRTIERLPSIAVCAPLVSRELYLKTSSSTCTSLIALFLAPTSTHCFRVLDSSMAAYVVSLIFAKRSAWLRFRNNVDPADDLPRQCLRTEPFL